MRQIGRREAEELLSGGPVNADRDALVRLLHLAAAPPRAEELLGREAVARTFMRARRHAIRVTEHRRRSELSLFSRALVVKTLALLAFLLLGGVAVAAGTGSLPPPVQQGAHDLLSPFGVAVPDGQPDGPVKAKPGDGHPNAAASLTASPSTPPATPAGVVGQCQAWQAEQRGHSGRASDSPATKALATVAGDPDKIAEYCATVLGQPRPSSSPSGAPSKKVKTTKPSPTLTPHIIPSASRQTDRKVSIAANPSRNH